MFQRARGGNSCPSNCRITFAAVRSILNTSTAVHLVMENSEVDINIRTVAFQQKKLRKGYAKILSQLVDKIQGLSCMNLYQVHMVQQDITKWQGQAQHHHTVWKRWTGPHMYGSYWIWWALQRFLRKNTGFDGSKQPYLLAETLLQGKLHRSKELVEIGTICGPWACSLYYGNRKTLGSWFWIKE